MKEQQASTFREEPGQEPGDNGPGTISGDSCHQLRRSLSKPTAAHLMVHYLPVRLHQGLGVEGRLSIQHLVQAHPQRPPVTLRPVAAHPVLHGLQDLWGDVVWSSHRHRGLDLEQGRSSEQDGGRDAHARAHTCTLTVPSSIMRRQDPKSARRMCPFMSSRTLSGLMSLRVQKEQHQ